MCWKYEDEYGWCFDHLFFDDPCLSLRVMLENEYNVNINDYDAFADRVFSFLSQLHEDGVIAPREKYDEKS